MPILNQLKTALQPLENSFYLVAYSGGLDSHVLVHAMSQLKTLNPNISLQVIHINHGLNPNADSWLEHCRHICADLKLDFMSDCIAETAPTRESIENWARKKRYELLAKRLPKEGILITAHHQDDQAETILLQLLRGAGPKGLSAMPDQKPFADGQLCRPLLNFSRQQLRDYAEKNSLNWLEDDSNQNLSFDRNYLRHEVMPKLRQRWSAVTKNLTRSATHCATASHLSAQLAEFDLATDSDHLNRLAIEKLQLLSTERQRNVLRYWLEKMGCPMPSDQKLRQIQNDVLYSRIDANPEVIWGHWVVRRFRQQLMVMPISPKIKSTVMIPWDFQQPLELPNQLGYLSASQTLGKGLTSQLDLQKITIRFRSGGERCQILGKKHHSALKKLFQEWGIPPWERDQIPLLYHKEQLISVIGYCICEPFACRPNELGWLILI